MESYQIKSTILLSIMFLGYWIVLRHQRDFHFNRYYLLGALLCSLVIPLISIPVYLSNDQASLTEITSHLSIKNNLFIHDQGLTQQNSQTDESREINLYNFLVGFYLLGVLIMFSRFLINLKSIALLKREGKRLRQGANAFIVNPKVQSPFVFGLTIFISERIQLEDDLIIRHEEVHVNERHAIDIFIIEIAIILLWFHPLVYLYRIAIAHNHEFLADEKALSTGSCVKTYFEKVIGSAAKHISLTSSFSFLSIKNRIKMISKKTLSVKYYRFKRMYLVILALIIFIAFSCDFTSETQPFSNVNEVSKGEFVVLLDAGHGGKDPGVRSESGITEKAITLEITKNVSDLFKDDPTIRIIPVRETDEMIPLESRIEREEKIDLFISLHVNWNRSVSDNTYEVFYSDFNSSPNKSFKSAQVAADEFRKRGLKTTVGKAPFFVLENSSFPAILIEAGYLSNKAQEEFLLSEAGQDQTANQIAAIIKQNSEIL